MKHRVRLDLSFAQETDAQSLISYARELSKRAVSIKESEVDEEISFCDYEICGHDEGLPCTRVERVEIRKLEEQPL